MARRPGEQPGEFRRYLGQHVLFTPGQCLFKAARYISGGVERDGGIEMFGLGVTV